MLGLGLACSHGAGLFRQAEVWPRMLERINPGVIDIFPTAQAERSVEHTKALHGRVHGAYRLLREKVADYKPDVIIMIGDDQTDLFDMSNNPALAIYTGTDPVWGRTGYDWDKPVKDRRIHTFKNQVELSKDILGGLVRRGFDMANVARFEPRGNPEMGVSHMVARIVPELDPSCEIPIVMILINEYYPPLPTAKRCIELGRALGEILEARPERIALCASGGLSHYPGEFNQGFIDIPLDQWVLDKISANEVDELEHLFTFDSHTLGSGTGEIRAWLSVAAAMNRPATVIDYMPVHSGLLGAGFAYWPAPESSAAAST